MAVPFTNTSFKLRCQQLALAVSAAIVLSGCGESSSSVKGEQFGTQDQPAEVSFDRNQLLASVTDNVILPTYSLFADQTLAQLASVSGYCDAISAQAADEPEWLQQARQSWRDAMTTWQMAEMMQIGPLLENNSNLRNKIYSWPNTSSCAVDQDVVLSEDAGYDITTRTDSRKGMDALEYLLFNEDLNHSCTAFGTAPEGWDQRSDTDKKQARCQFAKLVAQDLVEQSTSLLLAWQGDNASQGYAETLKNAGLPGNTFTDAQLAVNDVSDAMFYADKFTKDAKLATPLGIFANDCGLQPCKENVESVYARHSLENIIANIHALNLLFKGGSEDDSVGFDDYLVDVGDNDTAQKMASELEQALAHARSLQVTLSELLESQPEEAQKLHSELKDVTDQMKADFIQSLALELPATSAGDND